MRFFIYAYLALLMLGVLVNSVMWIRAKANIFFLIYEILAACYLTSASIIYVTPGWREYVDTWFCLSVVPLLIVDFYLTVWGRDELVCPPDVSCRKQDIEAARVLAVVFVAPAYICGILLLLENLTSVFKK